MSKYKEKIKAGLCSDCVIPVCYLYKNGHFNNDEEAKGAFRLAYMQALDGMGKSIEEWMGLSRSEFDNWMRNKELPLIKRKKK